MWYVFIFLFFDIFIVLFLVFEDVILKGNILLVFEGLDIVVIVLVNNVEVGYLINMFYRYIFSVKGVLKIGMNKIEVRFIFAVFYVKE